jgi:hypothetical protein
VYTRALAASSPVSSSHSYHTPIHEGLIMKSHKRRFCSSFAAGTYVLDRGTPEYYSAGYDTASR